MRFAGLLKRERKLLKGFNVKKEEIIKKGQKGIKAIKVVFEF
jgi:hypothetical protein